MSALVRLGQLLFILALALVTMSLVIGLARSETGPLEKVAMVGAIAGCVLLAAKVTTLTARVQARLRH